MKSYPKRILMGLLALVILLMSACQRAPQLVSGTVPPTPTPPAILLPTATQVPEEEVWDLSVYRNFAWQSLGAIDDGETDQIVSPIMLALSLSTIRMGADETTAQTLDGMLGTEAADMNKILASVRQLMTQVLDGTEEDSMYQAGGIGLMIGEGVALNEMVASRLSAEANIALQFVDHEQEDADQATANWISNVTQGRIASELQVDINTGMLAPVSAMAISLVQGNDFRRNGLIELPFYGSSDKPYDVSMVFNRGEYEVASSKLGNMVIIPIDGTETELWLMMPADGYDVGTMVAALNAETVQTWRQSAKVESNCEVWFTPFNLKAEYDLLEALEQMGLGTLGDLADYSGLGSVDRIGAVVHSASFDIMEDLPEEANGIHIPQPSTEGTVLLFDHPFVAAVVDKDSCVPYIVSVVRDPVA